MRVVPPTTLTGSEDWPTFSPDGTQVAFEWSGERNYNADSPYVTLVGTRDIHRLTPHPAPDFAPVWSPDGHHIAFERATDKGLRVRLVSPLGGPDVQLSDFPVDGTLMSWSPDSRFIAASRHDSNASDLRGIYLLPLNDNLRERSSSCNRRSRSSLQHFRRTAGTSPTARAIEILTGAETAACTRLS